MFAGLKSRCSTPFACAAARPRAQLARDLDPLVDRQPADPFQQRGEILAVDVLHRQIEILIDHARARVADKRGGVQQRVSLSAVDGWNPIARGEDLLALDEVLAKLEKADPRAARVVELRFFGGLSEDEVAEVLGVSAITVKRDWRATRAWLIGRLQSRQ